MITYDKQIFGLNLLFRVHGSAVYRSFIPGFLSMCCLILFRYLYSSNDLEDDLDSDYVVGVLISVTTFLLVFRANNSYSRYWQATGYVFKFMSKTMDATIHTAVFHMQCDHYDKIKPPSYYTHPELNQLFLSRSRERVVTNVEKNQCRHLPAVIDRSFKKSIETVRDSKKNLNMAEEALKRIKKEEQSTLQRTQSDLQGTAPKILRGVTKLDGNWGALFDDDTSTYCNPHASSSGATVGNDDNKLYSFSSYEGGRTPSLFLQELAHLSSLYCAVALSTLRNDIDGSQSPLGLYEFGKPWPEVDSDKIKGFALYETWYEQLWPRTLYILGAGKSPEERTRYNAARPLPVIGGVSDNEILFLQMARGPYAKVALCCHWLLEFMTREHLSGSTGKVGPPIISRLHQFLSDSMAEYNNARKVMFIPFPFPHSQLSSLFIVLSIPAVAYVLEQYTVSIYIGCIFSFLSVSCLSSIDEVARELENPFRNIPNELPLVTLIAQFNEALITMNCGYHPDHFWDASEYNKTSSSAATTTTKDTDSQPSVIDKNVVEKEEQESKEEEKEEYHDEKGDCQRHDNNNNTTNSSGSSTFAEGQRQSLIFLQSKLEEYEKEMERMKTSIQSTLQ